MKDWKPTEEMIIVLVFVLCFLSSMPNSTSIFWTILRGLIFGLLGYGLGRIKVKYDLKLHVLYHIALPAFSGVIMGAVTGAFLL